MSFNKSQSTLFIYKKLLEEGEIKKSDVLSILSISDLTFRRYIQEIRAYLINFNEPYEIVYVKTKDTYILRAL